VNIPLFSVRQRLLVNLLVVVLAVWGIWTYFVMPKESFPQVSLNEAYVITFYAGASPEEIENLVTRPIEEEIQDVKDIDFLDSISSEGRSVIRVVFDQNLSDEDLASRITDLRSEVDKVTNLPEGAEDPIVLEINSELIWPVLLVALSGEIPMPALRDVAEDLADAIREVPGVSGVELQGEREEQVLVEVDPARLEAHGLTLEEIRLALAASNLNLPAGTSDRGGQSYVIRTVGQFETLEDVARTPLISTPRGVLRVGDLARVRWGMEETRVRFRVQGRPGLGLIVYKKEDADLIQTSQRVRQTVEAFREGLDVPVKIQVREDSSYYVSETLNILRNNAVLGAILVIIALWLVLGFRNALLAAFGIPFTFLTSFIFLHLLGITLNYITLFSLVLVLGMVVDDAIVIIENVHRRFLEGLPMKQAAVEGTLQVMAPVASSVSTTAIAFLPMLLMEGYMGKFLSYIPKTVAFALMASLMEAFWALPAHMVDFGSRSRTARRPGATALERLRPLYLGFLGSLLRHKARTVAVSVLVLFGAIFLVTRLDVELFPEADIDILYASLEMPAGTSLDVTEQAVAALERAVESLPEGEVSAYVSTVGLLIDPETYRSTRETHVGQVAIDLTPFKTRDRNFRQIAEDLRQRTRDIPGVVSLRFEAPNTGPAKGKPVEIRVRGDDLEMLSELAGAIEDFLATLPGVRDIHDDLQLGKNEIRIEVDEERAALRRVRPAEVARTARMAYHGVTATTFRGKANEEFDIVVKLAGDDPSPEEIRRLRVRSATGELVPIAAVATLEPSVGYSAIHRRDLDRAVTITADVDRTVTNPVEVQKAVAEHFADFATRYPGYLLEFGGEYERTQSSFESMYRAIAIAMLLIYTILVVQFRSLLYPLVVMVTVPFSIVGVAIGLYVMDLPLDIDALIAVLALCGLVVNGSIVLVSFINEARRRGLERLEAVREAAGIRMRPILLTNFTTILGLLPMALGLGGISPTWRPMATSLIWGLAFASLVTLVLIPVFYVIGDDIRAMAGHAVPPGTERRSPSDGRSS
jgi:multidrug efflux pump subunit AcrB